MEGLKNDTGEKTVSSDSTSFTINLTAVTPAEEETETEPENT